MINAVLIDDEKRAIETLVLMLKKYCPEVTVLGTANGLEGLAKMTIDAKIDLVFLDINLGQYNGFDVLKKFDFGTSKVVFVTAHDNYGLEAIKAGAFDYIVKPIDPDELQETVSKFSKLKFQLSEKKSFSNAHSHIIVPVNNAQTRISTGDIMYIEADGAYSRIYEKTESLFCAKPIKYFEEVLDNQVFLRIHHSFLVNINEVRAVRMGRDQPLILKNGTELPISRNKRQALMDLLSSL